MLPAQRDSRFRPRVVNKLQGSIAFLSALLDNYFRFLILRCRDNRNAWLNDSRFFASNLSNGMSEPFFVIEIDRRNDRDVRWNRTGRIKASAHSGFEHKNLASLFLKMLE